MPIALIIMGIAAVAPVIGDLIGKAMAAGDQAKADELINKAMSQYGDIIVPKLKEIQAQNQGNTELSKISTDPSLARRQLGALDRFEQVAREGGMTLSDKATLHDAMDEVSQQERGDRGAIVQNAQARGAGPGIELASQLLSEQSGANRSARAGEQQAAAAQQRALDAYMKQFEAAGSMRGQEYGEKSAAAKAQDEINRFNITNSQNMGMYNNSIANQNFGNDMALAGAKSGAYTNGANVSLGKAANTQQMWGGIGGAVGAGAGAIGQNLENSQAAKDKAAEAERQRRAAGGY